MAAAASLLTAMEGFEGGGGGSFGDYTPSAAPNNLLLDPKPFSKTGAWAVAFEDEKRARVSHLKVVTSR